MDSANNMGVRGHPCLVPQCKERNIKSHYSIQAPMVRHKVALKEKVPFDPFKRFLSAKWDSNSGRWGLRAGEYMMMKRLRILENKSLFFIRWNGNSDRIGNCYLWSNPKSKDFPSIWIPGCDCTVSNNNMRVAVSVTQEGRDRFCKLSWQWTQGGSWSLNSTVLMEVDYQLEPALNWQHWCW